MKDRATAPARPRVAREAAAPFASTNRWLRGRILDRLRAAPDGAWVALDDRIGDHEPARVRTAATRLAADGVVELKTGPADGPLLARLPLG